MIDYVLDLFKRKNKAISPALITHTSLISSKPATLEDYVSRVNKNLNGVSMSTQKINVSLYIDQLFKDTFSAPDIINGLKEANTLFTQTFDTSLDYHAVTIKTLYSGNYALSGLSTKEGEIFKEYAQYKFGRLNPIHVYLTHIPFVKVPDCSEENVGIAQIGYPYAVINSNATPEKFHVAFLHELSHCLNARHVTDPSDVMYEMVSQSANHWDDKNISVIKEGIVSQIKYGEANDWFF